MSQTRSPVNWRRIVAAGALWMVVYNLIWGAAWFAFMRTEWADAMAAGNRPMPWTAEVWFLWVTLTLPIGVAITAYAAGRQSSLKALVSSSSVIWLVMTMGMAGWAWQESISMGVIALDSVVNLIAMVLAAIVAAWSLQDSPASETTTNLAPNN